MYIPPPHVAAVLAKDLTYGTHQPAVSSTDSGVAGELITFQSGGALICTAFRTNISPMINIFNVFNTLIICNTLIKY